MKVSGLAVLGVSQASNVLFLDWAGLRVSSGNELLPTACEKLAFCPLTSGQSPVNTDHRSLTENTAFVSRYWGGLSRDRFGNHNATPNCNVTWLGIWAPFLVEWDGASIWRSRFWRPFLFFKPACLVAVLLSRWWHSTSLFVVASRFLNLPTNVGTKRSRGCPSQSQVSVWKWPCAAVCDTTAYSLNLCWPQTARDEIQALQDWCDVGWMRVNMRPIKQVLGTYASKWMFVYTKYLSDQVSPVKAFTHAIFEAISDAISRTKRALPYPGRMIFSRSIAWIGKKIITHYLKTPLFPISANLTVFFYAALRD